MTTMVPPAIPARRAAAAAVALVLLLAGCGAELGEGAGASGGGGGGDDTTTTRAPKKLTIADLESIRPQAKDVPDDYRTLPRTGDTRDHDEALEDSCPDLAPYFAAGELDPADEVAVQFQTQDGRALAIGLALTPLLPDADAVATFVTAVEGCDGYEYEDKDGVEVSYDFASTEPLEGFGDVGARVVYQQTLSFGGDTIEREFTVLRFTRNGVGISVGAASGVRQPDYRRVEPDLDEAQDLAEDLDTKVVELTQ